MREEILQEVERLLTHERAPRHRGESWVAPEHSRFGRYLKRDPVTHLLALPVSSCLAFQRWADHQQFTHGT